jgi:hypothetical protein
MTCGPGMSVREGEREAARCGLAVSAGKRRARLGSFAGRRWVGFGSSR